MSGGDPGHDRRVGADSLQSGWNSVSTRRNDILFLKIFFKVYLCILRRETEHMSGGWTERVEERIPSRLHSVSAEPNMGLEPMNCEIMT